MTFKMLKNWHRPSSMLLAAGSPGSALAYIHAELATSDRAVSRAGECGTAGDAFDKTRREVEKRGKLFNFLP